MSQIEALTPEMYETWNWLVSALELTARDAEEAWTVQTVSAEWEFGPYLQVCYNSEFSEMQVEITSNKFLDPPMPGFDVHRMKELGWTAPLSADKPNWFMFLPHDEQSCAHIARIWVRTLLDCYNMQPQWKFGPAPLAFTVVKPWTDFMVKRSGMCMFSLIDRQGRNRAEIADFLKAERERKQKLELEREAHAKLFSKIGDVLYRAERLGLQGMDVVRLSEQMYDKPVVLAVSDMVINGAPEVPNYLTWERLAKIGIYRRSEIAS